MMEKSKKYDEEKNSDELSQKFHDKAGEIARDLNRQLLSLSTGIIGAFFVLVFNKDGLSFTVKFFIFLSIVFFGLAIYFITIAMQNDSSKNYFLGHINDSTKQTETEREVNIKKKKYFNTKQLKAKTQVRIFFLLGILSSVILVTIYLFFDS